MKDLNELTKRIIAFRDARDWKQFHNPKDLAISLVLGIIGFLIVDNLIGFVGFALIGFIINRMRF